LLVLLAGKMFFLPSLAGGTQNAAGIFFVYIKIKQQPNGGCLDITYMSCQVHF
jgi:hypothetical protein